MYQGKDLLTKSCWQQDCSLLAKPEPSFILKDSCSIIYQDEVYFYGAREILFDTRKVRKEEIWIDISVETQLACNKTMTKSTEWNKTCTTKQRNGLSKPNKIVQFDCSNAYNVKGGPIAR